MTTEVIHTVAALRAATAAWRTTHPHQRLALVPTMGALHEGHLRLIDHALAHADAVIVSLFVNPTQFAPGEDFERYPRTLAADQEACAGRGVQWIFAPSAREMYPEGDQTEVAVPELAAGLCGVSRPHFFGGVADIPRHLFRVVNSRRIKVAARVLAREKRVVRVRCSVKREDARREWRGLTA